jgi:hypothetical protein
LPTVGGEWAHGDLMEQQAILNLLAPQPGKKRAADILACRVEFAWMLDGAHAREAQMADRAEWAELLS